MDFLADPSGNIIVHECGCVGHGPVTLWDMHDLAWRQAHIAQARTEINAQEEGQKDLSAPGAHRDRFIRAHLHLISKSDPPREDKVR